MHPDHPDLLVAARKECPLIVGIGDGETFVASAIPAFLAETRRVMMVENGEIVTITPEGVEITDADGNRDRARRGRGHLGRGRRREGRLPDLHDEGDPRAARRGRRDDHRPPAGPRQRRPLRARARRRATSGPSTASSSSPAGPRYHAGLVGRYAIEQWARVPVEMDVASEFRYRDPVIRENDLVIGITQSGETADTLAAMRLAREGGAKVLAVTNIMGSQATRDADAVLFTRAGLEIGVAATKTFVSQVAAMYLLGLRLAELRGTLEPERLAELIAELKSIPSKIEETIASVDDRCKAIARTHHERRFFLYLGRHIGLPVCLEGALKLKEISYIPTDAYAAGEMKHGPIALLDESTPVVAVATDSPVLEKMLSNVEEVRARGADVVAIATRGLRQGRARSPTRPSSCPRPTGSCSRSSPCSRCSCSRTTSPGSTASTSTSRGTWRRPSPSSRSASDAALREASCTDRHPCAAAARSRPSPPAAAEATTRSDGPASLVPADAPVYFEAVVKPEGEAAESAEAALGKITDEDDPGQALIDQIEQAAKDDGERPQLRGGHRALARRERRRLSDAASPTTSEAVLIIETTDADKGIEYISSQEDATGEEKEYEGVTYQLDDDGDAFGKIDDFIVFGDEAGFKKTVDTADGDDTLGRVRRVHRLGRRPPRGPPRDPLRASQGLHRGDPRGRDRPPGPRHHPRVARRRRRGADPRRPHRVRERPDLRGLLRRRCPRDRGEHPRLRAPRGRLARPRLRRHRRRRPEQHRQRRARPGIPGLDARDGPRAASRSARNQPRAGRHQHARRRRPVRRGHERAATSAARW